MKNSQSIFLVFCLAIVIGLMQAYHVFEEYFSPMHEYQAEVENLKEQIQQKEFQSALLEGQFSEFRQEVARALPESFNSVGGEFKLDQLAGSLRVPASEHELDLSGVALERSKKLFREKKYDAVRKELEKVVKDYPTSLHIVESYFFLAEASYLMADYQVSLDYIESMLTQFPESELTGFIMLRMGQIYELRDRPEDAAEIYRTIMRSFSNDSLKKQAKDLLGRIES